MVVDLLVARVSVRDERLPYLLDVRLLERCAGGERDRKVRIRGYVPEAERAKRARKLPPVLEVCAALR